MHDHDANPSKPGQFQMTWQVAVILALTFGAMAIPLLGVALFMSGALKTSPEKAVAQPVNTEALAASLARVADDQLGGGGAGGTAVLGWEQRITVPAGEILEDRAAVVARLGQSAGGSALEIPGGDGGPFRVVLHVPKSRRALVQRAVAGEKIDFSSIPASREGEILTVILEQAR